MKWIGVKDIFYRNTPVTKCTFNFDFNKNENQCDECRKYKVECSAPQIGDTYIDLDNSIVLICVSIRNNHAEWINIQDKMNAK